MKEETPAERQTRLKDRVAAEKAKGTRGFLLMMVLQIACVGRLGILPNPERINYNLTFVCAR